MDNLIGSKIKSNIKRESNKFMKIVKKDFKSHLSNLIKSKISNEGSNSENEEQHLEIVFKMLRSEKQSQEYNLPVEQSGNEIINTLTSTLDDFN